VDASTTPGDYTISFTGYMHGMEVAEPTLEMPFGVVNATLRVKPGPARRLAEDFGAPYRNILDPPTQWGALRSDTRYWAGPPPAKADRSLPFVITAGFATEETKDGQARLPASILKHLPNGASDRQFWRVNNESWVDPTEPLYITKGARGVWSEHPYDTTKLIHSIKLGEVVDIVVQNVGTGSDPMFHPLHLHGYKYWVIAQGKLPFPDVPEAVDYNLEDPAFVDTYPVFTGHYAVFRVVFDNPGMWHFHCHLLFHMGLGLQTVFNVAEADQPEPPPEWYAGLSAFR